MKYIKRKKKQWLAGVDGSAPPMSVIKNLNFKVVVHKSQQEFKLYIERNFK